MSSAGHVVGLAADWQEKVEAAAPVELPVTTLTRRSRWAWLELGEFWHFRDLFFFLTWRDIKIRYKQTVLGAAWAVVQPFATMVLSTVDTPYPLFVFAGLLPWTFFANAIGSASQSIVGNERLVTKVYFPRLIIPTAAIAAGLVDFAIAFGVLLGMMLWYGVLPGWGILLVPFIALALVTAAVGMGALLAALTVAYRDFRYVVPFSVQLWMFATPCIYLQPETVLEPLAQTLMPLNPVYGVIVNFRAALLGGPFDLYAMTVSSVVGLVLLLAGAFYFRQVEQSFADII
jgi:lipopolysaccharide transport system permease protein